MKIGEDYIGVGCGALIVNDKDEVLLLKRTGKSTGGGGIQWARPGGCIEYGEAIKEALIREVKEEFGVEIELFGPLSVMDDIREDKGNKVHWIAIGAFARIVSGKIINLEPDKHSEVKWFSLDDLPNNIAHYSMQGIEEYREYLKSNN